MGDRVHSISGSNPYKRKAVSPALTLSQKPEGDLELAKQPLLLDAALAELYKYIKENESVPTGIRSIVARINNCGFEIQRGQAKAQRYREDLADEKDKLSAKVQTLVKKIDKMSREKRTEQAGRRTAEAATQTRTESMKENIKFGTSIMMNGVARTTERNIFKLTLRDVSQEAVLEGLLAMKEKMTKGRRRKAHMPKVTGVDETMLRKMVELAWLGEDLKCVIHVRKVPPPAATGTRQAPPPTGPLKKRERDKVVFVSTEGTTYSDVLAKVRESLLSGKEDKVHAIRETRSGQMLIVLDKEADGDRVRTAVAAASPEAKVIARGGTKQPEVETTKTLLIQGMDALTSAQEVEEAARERLVEGQEVTVGVLRKGYGGTMTTTIVIPKEAAGWMMQGGRITVGPVTCRIRENVTLRPCLKCHSYEHETTESSRKGGARTCHKCGEAGHLKKDCKKGSRCVVCKVDGHSAHTGKCPSYRSALKTAVGKLGQSEGRPERRNSTGLGGGEQTPGREHRGSHLRQERPHLAYRPDPVHGGAGEQVGRAG